MITSVDMTGRPESLANIKAALAAIETEINKNPLLLLSTGCPALLHFTVIHRALKELISLREPREP